MIEKEKLQAEINSLVERQSIYISSRPSTAYGLIEPMPSIPALPADGPSFAERLSHDDRPRTAPSQSTTFSPGAYPQERTIALAAAAFTSHPPQLSSAYSRVRVDISNSGSSPQTTPPRQEFRKLGGGNSKLLPPPHPLFLLPPPSPLCPLGLQARGRGGPNFQAPPPSRITPPPILC